MVFSDCYKLLNKNYMSELKKAKAKADKYFSLYVRIRDAKDEIIHCCTCGERFHYKSLHCGHFISRRYDSTRYEEQNTGPQCASCNTFNQGRQFEFSKYLDKKYGSGTSDKMLLKSKMLSKRNRYDYQVIAEEYKNKYKQKLSKDI